MLRNKDAYRNAAFDWSCLAGCFGGTKISVGDVDGIVERKGNVMIMEAKPTGKDVQMGQRYLYEALVALGVRVVVVWHTDGNVTHLADWPRETRGVPEALPSSLYDLRLLVLNWFAWAQAHPAKLSGKE